MAEEVEIKEELQEAEEDKDELESALEGSKDDKGKGEGEEKGTEEDKEGDVKDKDEGKEKDLKEEPDPVELLRDEVKELRQMLRTSKRELTQTQAKLERVGKRPAASSTEDDEDEDEDEEGKGKKDKEEPLSTVEELQNAIAHIGATRGPSLDILLETMEQNKKYEDIRDVCSRGNFDDIFEVIAQDATAKSGGDFNEALLEVELNIWSKSNPYKYMYDLIKKYHPAYTKEDKGDGDKGEKKAPAKAPGTIVDKGGDSDLKSGWTAKRIDDMPEDELDKIPRDVYEKYMKGELD